MTIFELAEAKGNEEARLYRECFQLGVYAGQSVAQEKYAAVANTLGPAEARKVRAAEMENAASEYRNELRGKVVELNHKFDEAKTRRQEALEAALDPDVTTEAKL